MVEGGPNSFVRIQREFRNATGPLQGVYVPDVSPLVGCFVERNEKVVGCGNRNED